MLVRISEQPVSRSEDCDTGMYTSRGAQLVQMLASMIVCTRQPGHCSTHLMIRW